MSTSDVFLGIIALAVVVMAAIQVGVIIVALRLSKRAGETIARFEADVRPIVANLQSMSTDAAKAASIATAQVQRAEQLISDVTARVNDAFAVVQGLVGALAAFRAASPPARRPAAAEDEDPLFIG